MRFLLLMLIAIPLACAIAPPSSAQNAGSEADIDLLSSQPGTVAVLRGLDKISAETRDFEVPVDKTVRFGTFNIAVNYCRKTPPEERPEVFVYMNVTDKRTDGGGNADQDEEIFSGWMFASNPALNALEHPIYDVWVLDCKG